MAGVVAAAAGVEAGALAGVATGEEDAAGLPPQAL